MTAPKILDRIRKLLALSGSSNEHEAATAAARAAELLAEHQLSKAMLCDDELEPVGAYSIDEAGRCVSWKGSIADGCARAFGCRMFWRRENVWDAKLRRRKVVASTVVVGREGDVDGVRYMYRMLVREVARLADVTWTEMPRYVSARRWKNSFRLGCANHIQRRLIDQRMATLGQAAQDVSNSQAIMRLGKMASDVQSFLDGLNLRAGGAPSRGRSGYDEGAEAGSRVNLSARGGQLGAPASQLGE